MLGTLPRVFLSLDTLLCLSSKPKPEGLLPSEPAAHSKTKGPLPWASPSTLGHVGCTREAFKLGYGLCLVVTILL